MQTSNPPPKKKQQQQQQRHLWANPKYPTFIFFHSRASASSVYYLSNATLGFAIPSAGLASLMCSCFGLVRRGGGGEPSSVPPSHGRRPLSPLPPPPLSRGPSPVAVGGRKRRPREAHTTAFPILYTRFPFACGKPGKKVRFPYTRIAFPL